MDRVVYGVFQVVSPKKIARLYRSMRQQQRQKSRLSHLKYRMRRTEGLRRDDVSRAAPKLPRPLPVLSRPQDLRGSEVHKARRRPNTSSPRPITTTTTNGVGAALGVQAVPSRVGHKRRDKLHRRTADDQHWRP